MYGDMKSMKEPSCEHFIDSTYDLQVQSSKSKTVPCVDSDGKAVATMLLGQTGQKFGFTLQTICMFVKVLSQKM